MPRPVSDTFNTLKTTLSNRLEEGGYSAGDRFYSNRDLSRRFGISYQTAHRLISDLVDDGYLRRQRGSGTFVRGTEKRFDHALLLFDSRAQQKDSFGALLLKRLSEKLSRDKIPYRIAEEGESALTSCGYPVLWERESILQAIVKTESHALLLHDRPPPGLGSSRIDSIAVDDFSGGAMAGQILKERFLCQRLVVLAGPREDYRSRKRVEGFQLISPHAKVIHAPTWYYEDAIKKMPSVLRQAPDGIFCCNDRLAEAVEHYLIKKKKYSVFVIGFDNAPVAELLHLNSIAIPWSEWMEQAVGVIKKRLRGNRDNACHQTLSPRPILRRKTPFA